MRPRIVDYFSLERKTLMLSVLLHLVAARTLIFSFPIKDVAFKPILIFWGSFFDTATEEGDRHPKIDRQPPDFLEYRRISGLMTHNDRIAPEKPTTIGHNTPAVSSNDKCMIKSTFLNEKASGSALSDNEKKLFNQTRVRYEPLRTRTILTP